MEIVYLLVTEFRGDNWKWEIIHVKVKCKIGFIEIRENLLLVLHFLNILKYFFQVKMFYIEVE